MMRWPWQHLLLFAAAYICLISGILSSRVVTLSMIQIYRTHEWLGKPTVYFKCKGENVTFLPDVKKKDSLYTFKGEESWQPLTELPDKKCKRCGLYEKDSIKHDDVFDEWELCSDDFVDGVYVHFKEKEFNATFLCPGCPNPVEPSLGNEEKSKGARKHMNVGLVVLICILASIVGVTGMVTAYRYWQKRKREQEQARFLKLFEESDELEDELGLDPVL